MHLITEDYVSGIELVNTKDGILLDSIQDTMITSKEIDLNDSPKMVHRSTKPVR